MTKWLGNRANPSEIWTKNSCINRFKVTVWEACLLRCGCWCCSLDNGEISYGVFLMLRSHKHCVVTVKGKYVYSNLSHVLWYFTLQMKDFPYLLDSGNFLFNFYYFFFLESLLKFHLVSLGDRGILKNNGFYYLNKKMYLSSRREYRASEKRFNYWHGAGP